MKSQKQTVHLIAGLPRSGSTLLCNILAQNPRFHAEGTSGLLDLLVPVRNGWLDVPNLHAIPVDLSRARLVQVLRAMADGFYGDVNKPVVFDKNRGWPRYLEMAAVISGRRPRVLVCVRDLRDVIASFELLWRKTSAVGCVWQETTGPEQFSKLEDRCMLWVRGDQPVGHAYNGIKDALARGWRDCMHFVRYEELTAQPAATLAGVYGFLGERPYEHDFEHVAQVTWEDDRVHRFTDLHTIRSEVKPQKPRWPDVLGPMAERFRGEELW
jgi:sulfotransferase